MDNHSISKQAPIFKASMYNEIDQTLFESILGKFKQNAGAKPISMDEVTLLEPVIDGCKFTDIVKSLAAAFLEIHKAGQLVDIQSIYARGFTKNQFLVASLEAAALAAAKLEFEKNAQHRDPRTGRIEIAN